MFKYRDHRGNLSESMETVQEFETRDDLIDYLKKELPFPILDFRLSIAEYIYDARINWSTYIVHIEGFGVVGFTDGPV